MYIHMFPCGFQYISDVWPLGLSSSKKPCRSPQNIGRGSRGPKTTEDAFQESGKGAKMAVAMGRMVHNGPRGLQGHLKSAPKAS